MLGIGEWKAYLTEQGGGQRILDIPWNSISINPAIDNIGTATLNFSEAGSRSLIRKVAREWEHEVIIYRNNNEAFVGPITAISGAEFQCQDLFAWMDVRIVDKDIISYGDAIKAFSRVFGYAYGKDPRPNIRLALQESGVQVVRRYKGEDAQKAGDLLRELARTALDFTTQGRTIYVGGADIFTANPVSVVLVDSGVVPRAKVSRDGSKFGTDYRVFAGRQGIDGQTRAKPLVGRDVGGTEHSGLIERVATELQIKDLVSANANARARRLASRGFIVSAQLTPSAGFTFDKLICGRRVKVALSDEAADEEVDQTMRLVSFPISVGPDSETITVNLAPIDVTENDS